MGVLALHSILDEEAAFLLCVVVQENQGTALALVQIMNFLGPLETLDLSSLALFKSG